tara:strand:+ start:132 stop:1148 length:1017 start_codon:yes stop_codon:yes gene_type:complete
MKKTILLLFLSTNLAISQSLSGVENFILASENDKDLLANNYFNPLFKSMQISMSEGWARSAKTHKKFGFDITFFASGILIPESHKVFSTTGFEGIVANSPTSPTIFGDESNSEYIVNFFSEEQGESLSTSFQSPNGYSSILSSERLVLPNVQVGLGLPFKSEIIVRYMPKVSFKGVEFTSFGVGLKHSISQYFSLSKVTPFNLSLLLSSAKMVGDYPLAESSQISGDNQSIDLDISSSTFGLIGSADLKIVSLYASVSQVLSKSSFKVNGTYNVNYFINPGNTLIELDVVDPIDMSSKMNYLRKNIGLSLNFPFLKFFVDYSIQDFNTINAGLSFSIR